MEVASAGFDLTKCSGMCFEDRQRLVYELSDYPETATDLLQSWSRKDLLEVICSEMGKERKYTGINKVKMIEHLLRLVVDRKAGKLPAATFSSSPVSLKSAPSISKRLKRKERMAVVPLDSSHIPCNGLASMPDASSFCGNLACKAKLSPEDVFCKRCSCCICYHFDENKDPSVWLVCGSDSPNQDDDGCGLSCHLECALKHERAGISKNCRYLKLDGGFYCVSCGKVNGLLGCLRKQLSIAKDCRRVDVLCYRVHLSQMILKGSERFTDLSQYVNVAAKKLKEEIGPLPQVSHKMARGIVNRLSCGAEVQKLCSLATEALDSLIEVSTEHYPVVDLNQPRIGFGFVVRFEDVSPTSVMLILEKEDPSTEDIVGCRLWHRKATSTNFSEEQMCIFLDHGGSSIISGLDPSTEYVFRVCPFSSTRSLGEHEARLVTREEVAISSNNASTSPSSEGGEKVVDSGNSALEEENAVTRHASGVQAESHRDSNDSGNDDHQASKEGLESKLESHLKVRSLDEISNNIEWDQVTMTDTALDASNTGPQETPCKLDSVKEASKSGNQVTEREYEHCVKVIRRLECESHVDKEFRVKFLTWFSLKATMQEKRVVSVFVDTLIDDLASLAGQLVDAFSDRISNKRALPRRGFCPLLWH